MTPVLERQENDGMEEAQGTLRLTRSPMTGQQTFYLNADAVKVLGAPSYIKTEIDGDVLILRAASSKDDGARLSYTNPNKVSSCVFSDRGFVRFAHLDRVAPDRRVAWDLAVGGDGRSLVAPLESHKPLRPRRKRGMLTRSAHRAVRQSGAAHTTSVPQRDETMDGQTPEKRLDLGASEPRSPRPATPPAPESIKTALDAMERARDQLISLNPSLVDTEQYEQLKAQFREFSRVWDEYQKVASVLEEWSHIRERHPECEDCATVS